MDTSINKEHFMNSAHHNKLEDTPMHDLEIHHKKLNFTDLMHAAIDLENYNEVSFLCDIMIVNGKLLVLLFAYFFLKYIDSRIHG